MVVVFLSFAFPSELAVGEGEHKRRRRVGGASDGRVTSQVRVSSQTERRRRRCPSLGHRAMEAPDYSPMARLLMIAKRLNSGKEFQRVVEVPKWVEFLQFAGGKLEESGCCWLRWSTGWGRAAVRTRSGEWKNWKLNDSDRY